MQINNLFTRYTASASLSIILCLSTCQKKDSDIIIVIDDVIMLSRAATGLESAACANFPTDRSAGIAPGDSLTVFWSEGKSLPNDTIKIIRLEMLRDTGSLVQFTMTLRPLSGKPSEIQCMNGFGCDGLDWENFPWKSSAGNFLDHTIHQFRVIPRGKDRFTIENYHNTVNLIVQVNPTI